MVNINILEFRGYSEKDWRKFLKLQKTTVFDIAFPKTKREPFDDKSSMLAEYRIAACIGQDLEWFCEDFMYSVPALDEIGTFNFIVITGDYKQLALTLWSISDSFNERGEASDQYVEYVDIIHDYIAECDQLEEPCACRLLVNICNLLQNDLANE